MLYGETKYTTNTPHHSENYFHSKRLRINYLRVMEATGAVFDPPYSWLDENPSGRQSAAEVTCAVTDYNLRAIGAEVQNKSQLSDTIAG
jgi:hypothetical protein